MKKYCISTFVLGVVFSLSTAFAQATPVVDTVADQVDCTSLRYALSLGSKDSRTGGDVTNLQVYLSQTGYLDVDPTGYFGNATKKAVKAFQSANGIAPQGNVGPYTRAKIKELSCNGPVAQTPTAPVPNTPDYTTNPVMCTMEMVKCPDGSYSGRSGPNCETSCPKQITATTSPTVEFLSAPTLKLQYDSVGKESILEGKAVIKITAGLQAINIGYNVDNGQVAQILQFNNEKGATSANSMRFTAVGYPACVWSNTAGCLIPAGSSMTFYVTNTVKASQLFAGSYSMRPATFTYYDTNTTGQTVQSQNYRGISTSNSIMVVGETSPYITDVTVDQKSISGGYVITGSRFNATSNQVSINGVTKTLSSSTGVAGGSWILFNPSDFNLVSGNYYTVQVSTNEGASNLSGFTFSGVTQPVTTTPISVSASLAPSPASQFVIGGSMFGIANYNLSVQGGAGTLRSLTFTTTGTDAIGDFTVAGVTTAFVGGKATINGLNLAVPSTGLNLPVTVTFSGIMNSTVGGILTSGVPNVGITLTSAEVVSNGSVVVKPLNVSSNKMTLVASKPSVTMSSLGASSLFLGKENKIGEFTVMADPNGSIRITGATLNVSSSNIQNLQISSFRVTDSVTTITDSTISMSGSSMSVGFNNNLYQLSPGQTKTFSIYGTVSGTPQNASVPMYLSTSLVPSGFSWTDIVGGNVVYNGTNVYNFPTNSYSITGMGSTPTPVVTIPAPTISIGATPSSVTSGQSTTVSWTALNVNYCTVTSGSINDYGAGAAPLVGSQVIGPLTASRTVTVTCPGKNGTTATQSITIPVTASIPAPTVSIIASSSPVISGQSTLVVWNSTNAAYCTVTTGSIDDYAAGAAPLSGSKVVGPLTASRTATITCPGKNGTTATQSITIPVTAPAPVAVKPTITSLAFLSGMIGVGATADITFSSQNTNYCHLYMTPPGAPEMTLSEGYFSSKIVTTAPLMTAGTYNVVLYCWDALGAAASQTTTFTVAPTTAPAPSGGSGGGTVSKMVLGAFASNVSCVNIPRNLIRGSESSYVTTLQDFLSSKGFLKESSTGFYGDKTVEAVKDYQASKGLPTTGMVHDFTRQAIVTDTCQ